jgi:hypothetical protein
MSNINFASISTTYPVAGQDNDSQGFRDNFTNISAALATAKSEITALQTNTVLTVDLATSTTPVTNNLLGSTLNNGQYVQLNGVFFNGGTVAVSANINVNNGPVQQFTASGACTLTFNNWPTTGQFSLVRVILVGDQVQTRNVVFSTSNAGLIKLESTWKNSAGQTSVSLPATLQLNVNGGYTIIEAWTVDGGATVFMKQAGFY